MRFIKHSVERFRTHPASVRYATAAIIALTVLVVFIGAIIVWTFDHQDYPTFGRALWFTLQTVTTVGYGDATPEHLVGKIVAAIVMITAIGLITVVTAAVTSVFIEAARVKAQSQPRTDDADVFTRLEASLAKIADRLDQMESHLDTRASPGQHPDNADDENDPR
jgi:voltage-gated potassium channel